MHAFNSGDPTKLNLEDKEFILANGTKDIADKLWAILKDQPTPVPGIVVTDPANALRVSVTTAASGSDRKISWSSGPFCGGGRVGQGDLEQGALAGQRGPQLVRGVGGEAPLRFEGGLQPREQAVEGVGELLELVVGSVQGQPLVQAAGGDPPGGGRDRVQRAQHPAGQQPADGGGRHPKDPQRDGRGDQQYLPVEGDLRVPGADRLFRRLLDSCGELRSANACACQGTAMGEVGCGARRLPEEQVRQGEHCGAAGQERRAVQDGEAQPGGAAGQPRPVRPAAARAAHQGSPMR